MEKSPRNEKHRKPEINSKVSPDGGWGWAVVFGIVLNNFFLNGQLRASGVYLALLTEYHGVGPERLAWMASIQSGMMCLFGSMATGLARLTSPRKVAFCAGISFSSGLIVSSFSTDVTVLYFSLSFLGGLSTALAYFPGFVMLSDYFEKRRALANGIGNSGISLGGIVQPLVINFLAAEYGVQGALLIMGALVLHGCFGAMLWQPVEWHQRAVASKENFSNNKIVNLHKLNVSTSVLNDQDKMVNNIKSEENLGINTQQYQRNPGINSEQYERNPGINSEQYQKNPGINSEQYERNPGINSEQYERNTGINGEQYERNPGINGEQYQRNPGINSEQYERNTGINSEQYQRNPGINSEQYERNPGINSEQYERNPGINSEQYERNPGINSEQYQRNPGINSEQYQRNPGINSEQYERNTGINSEQYERNPGINSEQYQRNPGINGEQYQRNPGINSEQYERNTGINSEQYQRNPGINSEQYQRNSEINGQQFQRNMGINSEQYQRNLEINSQQFQRSTDVNTSAIPKTNDFKLQSDEKCLNIGLKMDIRFSPVKSPHFKSSTTFTEVKNQDNCRNKSFCSKLIDVSLLKQPMWWVLTLSLTSVSVGFPGAQMFLPLHALNAGLSMTEASSLVSFLAGADFLGRLLFSWFADLSTCSKGFWFVGGVTVSAVSAFTFIFTHAYYALILNTIVFGLSIGCFIPNLTLVYGEAFGSKRFAPAFSLSSTVSTLGVVAGPPLIGHLLEHTGSMTVCYIFIGMVQLIAASGGIIYLMV